jgi:hypothetical protein
MKNGACCNSQIAFKTDYPKSRNRQARVATLVVRTAVDELQEKSEHASSLSSTISHCGLVVSCSC